MKLRGIFAGVAGLALALPLVFHAQAPATIQPREKADTKLPRPDVRVETNVVLIPVAVNDDLGRPVAGLDRSPSPPLTWGAHHAGRGAGASRAHPGPGRRAAGNRAVGRVEARATRGRPAVDASGLCPGDRGAPPRGDPGRGRGRAQGPRPRARSVRPPVPIGASGRRRYGLVIVGSGAMANPDGEVST